MRMLWCGGSEGNSFAFQGWIFESLVFQPVHAHSGPWKETKGCQGQARLENEGRVIDQTLPSCSCGEGMLGGGGGIELQHRHTRRQTYALSDVYTERHSTQCNTQRIIMAPSEG